MGTTARGITYPESGDHTRLWEHQRNLAESTDTAIAAVADAIPTPDATARGAVSGSKPAGTPLFTLNVTFPAGRFTTAPTVVACCADTGSAAAYISEVRNVTTIGCTISFRHIDNSTAAMALGATWIAMGV